MGSPVGASYRSLVELQAAIKRFLPKPASEWTGVPLAAVLNEARLTRSRCMCGRAEGNDQGVPPTAAPGTRPFYCDKGLPIEKALNPDTILAWAQNGQLLEHLHGAPVRLLVPGWSGNWSVKWLTKLELTEQESGCWYHYQFYYYGNSRKIRTKS